MRRGMLLVLGFGVGGMMVLVLVWAVQAQRDSTQTIGFWQYDSFYPRSVMGTELLAVGASRYDGPFWEDSSNQEVAGVASLVVENQGGLLVTKGAVILETGEERMVFEFSFLPPGEKVLVLEKDRKPYTYQSPVTCYGWTREEYPENPGLISVASVGIGGLTLTNHTGYTVPGVEVQYKNYDPENGIFLGGITYCVRESDLLPREVRYLNPVCYSAWDSRVVRILQEMER